MASASSSVRDVGPVRSNAVLRVALSAILLGAVGVPAMAQTQGAAPIQVASLSDRNIEEVRVTARRRSEAVQDVPIPISVVSGAQLQESGAFNVNRVKELIPTVQLYSSNPRNTGVNIRGLGTTFGLTNDGIEPGVGFYVDGVFYARPAATTLDFIDVEQIEVLRGPQGTLFGKNTTAGAIVITTGQPSFTPAGTFELSAGNYGYLQAKGSITGPLSEKVAARVSFSGTQRDGVIDNVATQDDLNDLNNVGVRGQLLYRPSQRTEVTATVDYTRQRPEGYAQVLAGVVPTQRAANRQFEYIIDELGYQPVSRNPFDRKIDHDTPWRSYQDLGGASLNVDVELGRGTFTSTTAWRFWDWNPSNDRDFLGLSLSALSQAPSTHQQWTQELRYAGSVTPTLDAVVGVFAFRQRLKSDPFHQEEAGRDAWRFSLNPNDPLAATPGLLDGYGINTRSQLDTTSVALFGQLEWRIGDRLRILPGLRVNYDQKEVVYDRQVYGGLVTSDPALLALQRSVYSAQAFEADVDDTNVSGQLSVAYELNARANVYATYATSFKSVGVNLGGLPTDTNGTPILAAAQIEPEDVTHIEVGLKTTPTSNSQANLTLFNTTVKDYQAQVQSAQLGVRRGYLANAEKVRVRGAELDGNVHFGAHTSLYGAVAYTDAEYVRFAEAPVPLEETGGASFKDISGGRLPGISKWAASAGGEVNGAASFFGLRGEKYLALEGSYRSSFSSSASPSQYMNIDGYALLNARVGFRGDDGLSVALWVRNLLDKNYFEQLLPAGGGTGHYAAVLGDPRTYGITLRKSF